MRSQVRRLLYSRLFIAILAASLFTGAGSVLAGAILFRTYLNRAIQGWRDEALDRIGVFEIMMQELLGKATASGQKGLLSLAQRFPDRAAATAAGMEGMRRAAQDSGVDEVYFIGEDGKVFATSFEPDLGLDLFTIDPAFTAFLKGMFGSVRFEQQGISGSSQTGNRNLYLYYNPPGRPYIIEVSTRMRAIVSASYPQYDYTGLAALVLGAGEGRAGRVRPPVHVVDYLNDTGHSIVSDTRTNETVARLAAEGRLSDHLEWREGASRMVLERLALSVFASEYPYYVLFRIDESYYSWFFLASILVSFAVICGSSLVAFAGASRVLGSKIALRLETLAEAMERVERGEDAAILDDGADDEVSSIGRRAADMVTTIRRNGAELQAFARRLEEEIVERERKEADLALALESNRGLLRELDHRVKNNLQLMLSLARFQAGSANPELTALVEKMEIRIMSMALVEDRITDSGRLDRIEMKPLLAEQVTRIRYGFPGLQDRVECGVEAEGVLLGADDAMAVALIACELADNAFRHAFAPGVSGRFTLVLSAPPAGGILLEASDDGRGLPEPLVERLGLAVARALAAQRGWTLELGAAASGCGAKAEVKPAAT